MRVFAGLSARNAGTGQSAVVAGAGVLAVCLPAKAAWGSEPGPASSQARNSVHNPVWRGQWTQRLPMRGNK
ncbi:hypothetical protein [Polaromonas sp.]|uniref:hypothetical protein n=1 Tax=Polaromonas sp. TaxID=1869339 RepID=UPI0017EADF84|nr:hypothetical protein [Polaromonas sp.]NMM06981.1 hypothetical protein [Polaromonas sp.]